MAFLVTLQPGMDYMKALTSASCVHYQFGIVLSRLNNTLKVLYVSVIRRGEVPKRAHSLSFVETPSWGG